MRFIYLLVLIFATICFAKNMKLTTRTIGPEGVALEIDYLGSCAAFKSLDEASVNVASLNGNCIPIGSDNLQSDYFCSDVGKDRSIIHFVEIYQTDENTPYTLPYFVSFIPSRPFRVKNSVNSINYYRIPNCATTTGFCSNIPAVSTCETNPVTINKGYVMNKDTIYIAVNALIANPCYSTVSTCCSFVNTVTNSGICPNTAPTTLNVFPKRFLHEHDFIEHHEERPHHEEHHEERPHHDDGDHDEDDRPFHHEEHHNDGDHDEDDGPFRDHHFDDKKKK